MRLSYSLTLSLFLAVGSFAGCEANGEGLQSPPRPRKVYHESHRCKLGRSGHAGRRHAGRRQTARFRVETQALAGRSARLAQLARAGAEQHFPRDGLDRPLEPGPKASRKCPLGQRRSRRHLRPDRHAGEAVHDQPLSSGRLGMRPSKSSASTPQAENSSGGRFIIRFSPAARRNGSAGPASSAIRPPAGFIPTAPTACCNASTATQER